MYEKFLRPLLFKFDPEKVHHFSFKTIRILNRLGFGPLISKRFQFEHPDLEREVFGLKFKNPIGLAAGFDKDASLYKELSRFGFGFIEIGTVTPRPQEGNPKKRLFRLKEDRAIINRMGFNNKGVDAAVKNLKNKGDVLIGGNIGKNKDTPNKEAFLDYEYCFKQLYAYVDYFVVNVSSPNTPGLRELQEKDALIKLLLPLQELNEALAKNHQSKTKPILLKIAPDLTNDQLLDIITIVSETKIDGVIATNTTISRTGLQSENKKEGGGLSGRPLAKRSTEVIRFLHQKSEGAFPIIGVGGINSAEDADDKLRAGASLLQIYTGFIYEGPNIVGKINKGVLNTMSNRQY
ncbi:MAG: quinone-dependent dihydroorotate dehydrogenase [Leeuwenhoekiella sp.]